MTDLSLMDPAAPAGARRQFKTAATRRAFEAGEITLDQATDIVRVHRVLVDFGPPPKRTQNREAARRRARMAQP